MDIPGAVIDGIPIFSRHQKKAVRHRTRKINQMKDKQHEAYFRFMKWKRSSSGY
jgi:hypothetical protein